MRDHHTDITPSANLRVLILPLAIIIMLMMLTTDAAASGLPEACMGSRGGHADMNPTIILLESDPQDPIALRPEGVRSVLHPHQDLSRVMPGEVLRREGTSRRLILLLCDLRAARAPETLFHVYLNLPEHADSGTRARHLLAQFNFFAAVRSGNTEAANTTIPIWQSFDVTHAVGALAEHGVLATEVVLSILAAKSFDPESRPSVGRLTIVGQ